ncbi:MAG: polysaccharide pyruvyl transferase family protein [Muribaculaceae bacterium]|nr:polysaccharide pyruvyl transferase family protein [Roseburia sp.]MCM1431812.1 polysaccharide pyruvyl transferase family protein [Muribaculaceae bacterium]MCM1493493.1 polysaccharide pyruvyl transferase family protein [Muribaculaceae bacterium]
MKYGVLMHKTTMNLGDDIQSYASSRFLPHTDYIVDRENIDSFRSENNEPVGVIMSAWWMWQKWNWPPAECIVPKLVSMHMNNYGIYRKGSPIQDEWLQGVGGDFFRANGPIGCRDQTTLDFFTERGFEAYFSGCVTLTLPKMPKTEDAGTYVCLVDLKPDLEKRAREILADTGLEIRVMTHHCDYRKSTATMEERFAEVERTLTQYQNAKLVITRRLHVALPCLALETPVFCIVNMKDKGNTTRWAPYYDWVHSIAEEDFKSGEPVYDFSNPPANKTTYLSTRESLMQSIGEFIRQTEHLDAPIEEITKATYTEAEARAWQNELMHWTLDTWLHKNRGLLEEKDKYKKRCAQLEKTIRQMNGGELPQSLGTPPVGVKESFDQLMKSVYHKIKGK